MSQRRVRPSHQWIEEAIAAGQRRGLNPIAIKHCPDGTVEIQYDGCDETKQAPKVSSWQDVLDS